MKGIASMEAKKAKPRRVGVQISPRVHSQVPREDAALVVAASGHLAFRSNQAAPAAPKPLRAAHISKAPGSAGGCLLSPIVEARASRRPDGPKPIVSLQ